MPIRPIDPKNQSGSSPSSAPIVARTRVRAVAPDPKAPVAEPEPEKSPEPPAKRQHHVVDRSTSNWDENGDYIVGKGRPPIGNRWQKGQSGNPKGPKPKEKLDPVAMMDRELLSDFSARVNNQDVTLNTGTFVLSLLRSGAAKGSVRSQQILLELFHAAVRRRAASEPSPEIEAWEQDLIDQVIAQYNLPSKPVVRKERERSQPGEEQ